VNLRARFGFERVASDIKTRLLVVQSGSRSIGLLVDECREFMMIPAATVHPPGEALSGIGARYIAGIATIADRMVVVLKVEELLNPAEPILAA
jgi:purine-binding chemotaxis protein CheW